MKKYKAVIIDFRAILKGIYYAMLAAIVSIAGLYIISEKMLELGNKPNVVIEQNLAVADVLSTDNENQSGYVGRALNGFLKVFLGFNPLRCESVIGGTMPIYAESLGGGVVSITENSEKRKINNVVDGSTESAAKGLNYNIPKENQAIIKSIDASQRTTDELPIAIGNETSYGINIGEMLSSAPMIDMGGSGPKVLITHTHATESYADSGAEIYDVTASDRTNDKRENVVAVGNKMAEIFESYGIETIHDEILHDEPSFNGSYAHSLNTVLDYMKKYPSIQIVFDLHRDSIVYADKTKAKTVTQINGEDTAQLMFVVGTDENGLEHPNWRNNMKTAIHFQKAIADKYPKLMRHINLRRERFNGHTCGAAMIIEVGTSGNSLDEAIRGIELAARCIAEMLINN